MFSRAFDAHQLCICIVFVLQLHTSQLRGRGPCPVTLCSLQPESFLSPSPKFQLPNQIFGDFTGPLKSRGKATAKAKGELKQNILDFYNRSVTARRGHKKRLTQPGYPNLKAIFAWDHALQSATRGLGRQPFRYRSLCQFSRIRSEWPWRISPVLCKNARTIGRSGPCCKEHSLAAHQSYVSKWIGHAAAPCFTPRLWEHRHFLYTEPLHGWRWPGVIHMKNNNCKNALIAAKVSWACEKSLTSFFKRGPFEVAAFFGTLSENSGHTYDWTDDLHRAANTLLAFQLCHGRL